MTRRAGPGARMALLLAASASVPLVRPSAADAGISNRELVELVDISGLSVSPDGRTLVFRTERADVGRNSYVLRWHSVDLGSGSVKDIGSGGDPIYLDPGSVQPEIPVWAAGGRTIVVRALVDGAVGLWRGDVGGAGMVSLVVGDADVVDYSPSPDGTAIVYRTGPSRDEIRRAEQREYDTGILVDSSVDLTQNLFRGASINGRMATQRLVGYWFVKDGLLWQSPRQERRIDILTGKDAAVGAPQPVPPFTLPSLPPPLSAARPNGDTAVSARDEDKRLLRATFANGRTVTCADPLCATASVSSLVWRPGSRDLLVTFSDRERRQSLHLWDTDANRLRAIVAADGLVNGGRRGGLPCAVSAAAALCVTAGPASPPRVERVDLATGARKVLFDPNAALRASYRPDVRYLRWSIGDGEEATGVLMQPAGAGKRPAPLYLNYYSCEGFSRGGEGDEWPVSQLLEAGYAIACINSVPFKGAQDAVQNYETGLRAVRALIGQLSKEGIVDPSKVAMGGLSFGSEVAFWVAFRSDLLAVLSVTSPQPEPASYWLSAMPGSDIPATIRRVWGYGAPEETPERWRAVSPAMNVGKIRIPVLFQMPEMEARRVPELYARLVRQGTPTELYAFPDEAHIKVQPRHRLAAYERNFDWFRYWLEAHRDPDPAKADQYRRWDALRTGWKRPTGSSARTQATIREQPSH